LVVKVNKLLSGSSFMVRPQKVDGQVWVCGVDNLNLWSAYFTFTACLHNIPHVVERSAIAVGRICIR
jgi:hypothetical protein